MSYPDNAGGRSIVILDTGPIRELVTYRAVYDFRFMNLRQELHHLGSVGAYQNYSSFLSSFRKKVTSASVIVELNIWIRGTPPGGQRQLWQLVHDEFDNMGMEEDTVRFLEMGLDLIAKHGPVDVSLLEIARRNIGQRPVILTVDSLLQAECRKSQISSLSLLEACLGSN